MKDMTNLAITICATKKYTYAMSAQARRIQSALQYANIDKAHVILVGDDCEELKNIENLYKELGEGSKWVIHRMVLSGIDGTAANYQKQAQLTIAQLRTAAFAKARALQADYCWSLDSDVLPPLNALVCMRQMLNFDKGYYSIATCLYPTQGNGKLFLGGRGTETSQILPDFTEDERQVPEPLMKELTEVREKLKVATPPANEVEGKALGDLVLKLRELEEKAKNYPPKGDVYLANSSGRWKQRGWFDNAYPAIGKGAVVPSDWCGFGCLLMNAAALGVCWFDGYDGGGTEDLYIVWNRWYPNNLRIVAISHCLCDHISRNPGKPGFYIMSQAYHEMQGPCVGHLRVRTRPWYAGDPGERFDEKNNGVFSYPDSTLQMELPLVIAGQTPPVPPVELQLASAKEVKVDEILPPAK